MERKEASNGAPSLLNKSSQRNAEAVIANSQALLKQYQKLPDGQPH